MSYIPNVREAENGYDEKDLKGGRSEFLRGYDAAIEDVMGFFANMEMYSDNLTVHYLMENEEKAEALKECMEHYAELGRNETAVSLLDDQAEEEEVEDNENE